MLIKDNRKGIEEMNNLIMIRIVGVLKGYLFNLDLVSSYIRYELKILNFKIYMYFELLINMNFG